MDIERLYAIGKDMGLAGAALREWVDAERATERASAPKLVKISA